MPEFNWEEHVPKALAEVIKQRGIKPTHVAAIYLVDHGDDDGNFTLAQCWNPNVDETVVPRTDLPGVYQLALMLQDEVNHWRDMAEALADGAEVYDHSDEEETITDQDLDARVSEEELEYLESLAPETSKKLN